MLPEEDLLPVLTHLHQNSSLSRTDEKTCQLMQYKPVMPPYSPQLGEILVCFSASVAKSERQEIESVFRELIGDDDRLQFSFLQ